MSLSDIKTDVKNNKIREGYLFKRSKYLKEWRERWVVITSKFLYTFTSKTMEDVTDIVELRDVRNYKSYLTKEDKMVPVTFKIKTSKETVSFSAKNCNEKWSWLLTLERLMDFNFAGASFYNQFDWVTTKGLDSQLDFERGGRVTPAFSP